MVVEGQVRVLLMNLLQRSREVFSPALQEFKSYLQLLLPLYKGLPERSLGIQHLGRRAENNGVKTLDGEPVRLCAGFRWGVVNPVVVEYLFVLSKVAFLPSIAKQLLLGKFHAADTEGSRLSIDTIDSSSRDPYPCYSYSIHT